MSRPSQYSGTETSATVISQNDWYALYTRSRCEKKLHHALQKNNYQSFLPLVKEKRQWSDRIKIVEAPLLPGYVFVSILPTQIPEIYYYPWMVNFVLNEGKPAIIRQEEISTLAHIQREDFKIYPIFKGTIGDQVKITHGPFKGLMGTVTQNGNRSKVILHLDSIDQMIGIEINNKDVA